VGQLNVRLAIAADCRLGPHAFRVRTATGISNLLTFSVGALKEVQEVEPNNDAEHAQKIALDTTVNGVINSEDVDCFLVEAKKGERIVAEIEAVRTGLELFDPHVAILNAKGFVLASADNTPAAWYDAICATIAPADGAYLVQARDTAYRGSGEARYRLHVGRFPRPLAVCPAGGKPGQTLAVRWLGDVAGPWSQQVKLPDAADSHFGLCAQNDRGVTPWPCPLRLSKLDNVVEAEPNDLPAQATPFQAPAALNGVIEKPGDVDCFKFPAKKGQVFDVRVYARALRSPLDSVLSIHRSKGGRWPPTTTATGRTATCD